MNTITKNNPLQILFLGLLLLVTVGFCGGAFNPTITAGLMSLFTLSCLPLLKRNGLPTLPIIGLVIACSYVGVLAFTSSAPYYSKQDWFTLLIYAVTSIGMLAVLKDSINREKVCRMIRWFGCILAVFALLQFVTGNETIFSLLGQIKNKYPGRIAVVFLNPNYLGEFCAVSLVLAFVSFIGQSTPKKAKYIAEFALLLVAITLSGSRGAVLASWVGLILAAILANKTAARRRTLYVTVLLVSQFILLFSQGNAVNRTKTILTVAKPNVLANDHGESIRWSCWRGALKLWKQNPVEGIGPKLFTVRWHEVQPDNVQGNAFRVHSLWIQTLCEYGMLGLGLLLVGLGYLGRIVWLNKRRLDTTQLAGACGLAAMLGYETFDYSFYTPTFGILVITFVSLILSSVPYAQRLITPIYILLTCTLCWMGYSLLTSYHEGQFVQQAFAATDTKTIRTKLVEAQRCQPENDSIQLWSARLEAKLQMAIQPEHRDWAMTQRHVLAGLAVNPFALELKYIAAVSYFAQDPQLSEAYIQELNLHAPHSCKAAGLTYSYYNFTGNLTKAKQWEVEMNRLLQFKPDLANNPGNTEFQ